ISFIRRRWLSEWASEKELKPLKGCSFTKGNFLKWLRLHFIALSHRLYMKTVFFFQKRWLSATARSRNHFREV
ncbi:MAG: hypothetical protein WAT46_19425, partial [Saprospiraceae bacterium]